MIDYNLININVKFFTVEKKKRGEDKGQIF